MTTPESKAAKLIQIRCIHCGEFIERTERSYCGWQHRDTGMVRCFLDATPDPLEINHARAAALLGRKGGRSKSKAKVQAARDNGKMGGRPIKPKSPSES